MQVQSKNTLSNNLSGDNFTASDFQSEKSSEKSDIKEEDEDDETDDGIIIEESESDGSLDDAVGKFDNTRATIMRLKGELRKANKELDKTQKFMLVEIERVSNDKVAKENRVNTSKRKAMH